MLPLATRAAPAQHVQAPRMQSLGCNRSVARTPSATGAEPASKAALRATARSDGSTWRVGRVPGPRSTQDPHDARGARSAARSCESWRHARNSSSLGGAPPTAARPHRTGRRGRALRSAAGAGRVRNAPSSCARAPRRPVGERASSGSTSRGGAHRGRGSTARRAGSRSRRSGCYRSSAGSRRSRPDPRSSSARPRT